MTEAAVGVRYLNERPDEMNERCEMQLSLERRKKLARLLVIREKLETKYLSSS